MTLVLLSLWAIIVTAVCSFDVGASVVEPDSPAEPSLGAVRFDNLDNQSSPLQRKTCVDCHQQAHDAWQQSDHAQSMLPANKTSILANFDNQHIEHYGQKAYFFIDEEGYKARISYDNKTTTYPVKFTFGYAPLQQYLVETNAGKLQVLPFAWDSRQRSEGGQRWFHNYGDEEITPNDRLHWQQPLQNWNGMCADCHSDGLKRNYQPSTNSFATQFEHINVGCSSCHGDMSQHLKRYESKQYESKQHENKQNKNTYESPEIQHNIRQPKQGIAPVEQWIRNIGDKTAHWQGKPRDNQFMDSCFACHSLRAPLTDGFSAEHAFLDQFTPQLITAPNYYADGQIKEEVYVYGSFLQSKMFAAGVNCLDCHDKHTMKVKVEGNGLCLQCHNAEVFNNEKHHGHAEASDGAQCVNCHMPTNRYMGVDDRRDHSFKIPRPHLSVSTDIPNACTQCHGDKTNQWAANALSMWHGKPRALSDTKKAFIQLNQGQSISLEQHLAIIADTNLSVIIRASAIQMLSFSTQIMTAELLKPYLQHNEGLFRLSAASVAALLPPPDRIEHVVPLLKDPLKAVRVAAVQSLINSQTHAQMSAETDKQLSQEHSTIFSTTFNAALDELAYSNEISSWRGEGSGNQGLLSMSLNQLTEAEQSFKHAVNTDPYFEAGYVNLADLYRMKQQSVLANRVLLQGLTHLPKSGRLHYAYGLYLVRQKQLNIAITHFKKAMDYAPENAQHAYTYVLAIDGQGRSELALSKLKSLILAYENQSQLKELGIYLSQKLRKQEDFHWFKSL